MSRSYAQLDSIFKVLSTNCKHCFTFTANDFFRLFLLTQNVYALQTSESHNEWSVWITLNCRRRRIFRFLAEWRILCPVFAGNRSILFSLLKLVCVKCAYKRMSVHANPTGLLASVYLFLDISSEERTLQITRLLQTDSLVDHTGRFYITHT